MTAQCRLMLLPLYFTMIPAMALAEENKETSFLHEWELSGDFLGNQEYYQSHGDASASPYGSVGSQNYLSHNLLFEKRVSGYERISGRASGLLNSSEYRSQHDNYILEQFGVSWQKGDVKLPFAVDAGNYYATFSPRSLQRPLTGAMVELQPDLSEAWHHSFMGLSGFSAGEYRDLQPKNDFYHGFSWLAEREDIGSFIANVVYNHQDRQSGFSNSRDQWVSTMGAATTLELAGQTLDVEAETGLLTGNPASSDTEHSDQSYMFRLDGSSALPLDYYFLYEQYGQYYEPKGSAITADQQNIEGQVGWRFERSLQTALRFQSLKTAYESGNPLTTDSYGLRLNGAPAPESLPGLLIFYDGFYSLQSNDTNTTSLKSYSSSLRATQRINRQWNLNLGTRWNLTNDRTNGQDTTSRELSLGVDYSLDYGGWRGVISPELTLINSNAPSRDFTEISPAITTSLSYGNHILSASYRLRRTDQMAAPLLVNQSNAAFRYSYNINDYSWTLSGDYFKRDPIRQQETDAYRVGMQLAYHFNRPATGSTPAYGTDALPVDASHQNVLSQFLMASGTTETNWREKLEEMGYSGIISRGSERIVIGSFLSSISLTQELVAEFSNNQRLERSALVFTPNGNQPALLERNYQRIVSELIRIFGQPEASYEDGEFTTALAQQLASGSFRRVLEWRIGDDRLRFGIPQRLDGTIRFELQRAARMPAPQQPLWSVDL